MSGTIASICLHPIKAMDPVHVTEARVLASGALEFDRRWAVIDAQGKFVNGKRHSAIQRIRSEFDLAHGEVSFDGRVYSLEKQAVEIARFLSARLDMPVELRKNTEVGFPDDTESPGPTLVAQASLEKVGEWFGLPLEQVRRRFRVNIEVGGVPAFWEDGFYGSSLHLGQVHVDVINPCARCVVPTRDPFTAVGDPGFQQRFGELRQASLPAWARPALFTHYYRLTANTRIPASEAGKMIRVGDPV